MDAHIGGSLLLQLALIVFGAVFTCAETAVISINDSKLQQLAAAGDKRAARLVRLTGQPTRFLSAIQSALTLAGFLGSAFAAKNFSGILVGWAAGLSDKIPHSALEAIAVVLITLLLSYFTLVFGEMVPKRIAMKNAESIALNMSGLAAFISALFYPLVAILTVSANIMLRLFGIDPNEKDDEVSEEEIRMMVDVGSETGAIDPEEQQMINNVFEFDDLTAGEFVTHRKEVDLLSMDETDEEWEKTIFESMHSLYPVCEESADHIIGILHAREYFRLRDKSRESVMKNTVKEPLFVPESVCANVLFRQMKKTRNRLAVVLDEYGGMLGIVTMNDLLEQLVGDFDEDQDIDGKEETEIEKVGDNTWRIKGSADMTEVAQELNVVLPADEFETFGSFVFAQYGYIPEDGKQFEINACELNIRVTEVKEHRLENALVTPVEAA
ncbi:MAG: HlyC/CorC family transporter [Clostridia bacterium]|nr:HlyC/CorC family transporter [Clostridia bacterium]